MCTDPGPPGPVLSSVCRLRSSFPHDDVSTNPGYVLSPVISQRDSTGDASSSVKVSIEISESQQPVTFTCDGEHLFLASRMLRRSHPYVQF